MKTETIEALAKTGITITPPTHLQKKIDIARDFVSLHKEFDIPPGEGYDLFSYIYANLEQEYFGETRLVDKLTGEFEIEIPGHQTTSGKPILFNFVEPDFFENRLYEFANWILDSIHNGEALDGISQDDADEMHYYLTQLIAAKH